MRRTFRTLNDCEMQHNAEVGRFTKPSILIIQGELIMAKQLWKPSEERVKSTNMYRFMNFVNEKLGKNFTGYAPLYQWSIENIP